MELLQQLSNQFKTEKDEANKLQILVKIQENYHIFGLKENDETLADDRALYDLCDMLFQEMDGCSAILQGQIIVCITSILIVQDVVRENPSLVTIHISRCLEIIQDTKRNRVLRQMCCESLKQFEHHYPGLLSDYAEVLLTLCQKESTHALQSYSTLLTVVLENRIKRVTSDAVSAEISTSPKKFKKPTAFVISGELLKKEGSPVVNVTEDLPQNHCEFVHQCLSFLVEHIRLFTQWGKASIVTKSLYLIERSQFPVQVTIRGWLPSLLFCSNIFLVHNYMFLRSNIKDLSQEKDEVLLNNRLLAIIDDPQTPIYLRRLVFNWLWNSLDQRNLTLKRIGEDDCEPMFPNVFDDFEIVHEKLKFFSEFLSEKKKLPSQSFYLLDRLEDYNYYRPSNHRILIMFDFLLRILNENTFTTIFQFLIGEIDKHPSLILPEVSKLVNGSDSSISGKLLKVLEKEILSRLQHQTPNTIIYYFPIISRIFKEPTMNPNLLLKEIYRFLKHQDLTLLDYWRLGDSILNTFRVSMITHPRSKFTIEMKESLELLATGYNNLDIRDRSQYLLQLANLTHEKLSFILSEESNSQEAAIQVQQNFARQPKVTNIPNKVVSLEQIISVPPVLPLATEEHPDSIVLKYREHIGNLRKNSKLKISSSITVTFMSDIQELFGMALIFDNCSHLKYPHKIQIPYLSEKHPKTTFKFDFVPLFPYPAELKVQCHFSSTLGILCETELTPLKIKIQDMFLQCPLPEPINTPSHRLKLFEELWADSNFHHCQKSISSPKSLKLLQPYQIADNIFLIYLPPKFHLLMKTQPVETIKKNNLTTFECKSDLLQLFSCLDEFFQTMLCMP